MAGKATGWHWPGLESRRRNSLAAASKVRWLFCLPLWLALSPACWAQHSVSRWEQSPAPTPFGLRYYYTDAVQQALQGLPSAVQEGQQPAAEIAWHNGPYHPQRVVSLSEQAHYHEGRGDHGSAIVSLRRAVHLTRVNYGLHSGLQIPLLQRLNRNYLAGGQWQAADDTRSYLYRIQQRTLPQGGPEHIEASLDFVDWQRQVWLLELGKSSPRRLLDAWDILDDLSAAVPSMAEWPLPVLERLTATRMRLRYLLGQIRVEIEDPFPGSRDSRLVPELTIEQRRLQTLQRSSYSGGRQDLQRLLQRQQKEGAGLAIAATRVALGDWHLWHNRGSRAAEEYREAWRESSSEEGLVWRQRWLQQPWELPAGDVFFAPLSLRLESAQQTEVSTSFRVDRRGRVRQVEPGATGQSLHSRLSRWLRAARFRPAMAGGVPLDDVPVQRNYTVLH